MTKSRGINKPRWHPSADQLDELRRVYSTTPTALIADRYGVGYHTVARVAKRIGLRKDEDYLNGAGGRLDGVRGTSTRFQPGNVPWSKGRKLPGHAARTAFKPGQVPHNYLPVGSMRIAAGGYLQRKVTDTGYPPRDWKFVHRLVWEAVHGPVPTGHAVAFRQGRRTANVDEITIDALELLTKRELMLRNSITRMPPELAELSRLRGRITREINQRTKDAR